MKIFYSGLLFTTSNEYIWPKFFLIFMHVLKTAILEALGSGIGTGSDFCHSFSFSDNAMYTVNFSKKFYFQALSTSWLNRWYCLSINYNRYNNPYLYLLQFFINNNFTTPCIAYTMRTNLPKLLDLLIFCIYSLNFSLEFLIIIFFCNKSAKY